MKYLRIFFIICGILSTGISINYNYNNNFFYLFILPTFATFSLIYLIRSVKKVYPGISIVMLVIFLRYIIFIPLFILSGYTNFLSPVRNSNFADINFVVLLLIYEMVVINVVIHKLYPKFVLKGRSSFDNISVSTYVVIPMLLLTLFMLTTNIDLLKNYSFALSEYDNQSKPRDLGGFQDSFVTWTKLIFTVWFFDVLFKLFKKYNVKILYVISLLIPLFLSSFYTSNGRISLLLPFLSLIVMYRKLLGGKIDVFIALSFFLLTISFFYISSHKSINETKIEEETKVAISADLLNMYFAGFPNVLNGVQLSVHDEGTKKLQWLFNDVMSGVNGFASYFKNSINLHKRYGDYLYGNLFGDGFYDQILPTIVMGYYYLGFFLAPIFTVIMLIVVIFLDGIFANTDNVYLVFFSTYFSLLFGYTFVGSFMHLVISLTNTIVPILFFMLMSNFFMKYSFKKL